jgi:hypothetical protein
VNQRLLEEMPAEEFEQALDRFIAREPDEIPASAFLEALAVVDRERQRVAPVNRLLIPDQATSMSSP